MVRRWSKPEIESGVGQHLASVEIDDIVAAGAEVGACNDCVVTATGAQRGLPLDTELGGLVGGDLDDQRFDKDLRAPRVEFVDHRAQACCKRCPAR